jgi:hypothetical protein
VQTRSPRMRDLPPKVHVAFNTLHRVKPAAVALECLTLTSPGIVRPAGGHGWPGSRTTLETLPEAFGS